MEVGEVDESREDYAVILRMECFETTGLGKNESIKKHDDRLPDKSNAEPRAGNALPAVRCLREFQDPLDEMPQQRSAILLNLTHQKGTLHRRPLEIASLDPECCSEKGTSHEVDGRRQSHQGVLKELASTLDAPLPVDDLNEVSASRQAIKTTLLSSSLASEASLPPRMGCNVPQLNYNA